VARATKEVVGASAPAANGHALAAAPARTEDEAQAFQRNYENRLAADVRASQSAVIVEVEAVLARHFNDPAVVRRLMRDIKPIVAAGKEWRRRERRYLAQAQNAGARQ
jgi:hypothetical protein